MTSNWTPASLAAVNVQKTPYIWLDCSSSNLTINNANYVSYINDKFGSGINLNSIQNYNTITRQIPTQNENKTINGLSTVTFALDTSSAATGLTQVQDVVLSVGPTRGKMVLVLRQGLFPGTLFGVNKNTASPWQYKRTGNGSGGASTGVFANLPTTSTLFTSSAITTNALSNIPVPATNTIFMLSMSNLTSNQNFNGFGFNCETYLEDGNVGSPSNLNGWTGDFGELIAWREDVTATPVIQKLVEGYLAWKWGIQTYLDSNHTFYSNAPDYSIDPAPFANKDAFVSKVLWLDASDPIYTSTNFVLKIADKSGNGNDLNTRPEIKSFSVWPVRGLPLNGLITTRFTQYAGMSQPTSIENLSALFVAGRQLPSPSNGTWRQTLFGHDRYSDFGTGITSNQFYSNAQFPSLSAFRKLYCVFGGVVRSDLTFPPDNCPFILMQILPQVAGSNVTARFQGMCYDSFNADCGWIGDLGEVLLFRKKSLTLQQQQLTIMYLANKWGLAPKDTNSVFPNVKPFSSFSPKQFAPVAWYDSSDSQVNSTLTRFSAVSNNTSNISYQSNSTVVQGTPSFSVSTAGIAGKIGNFSGLNGTPVIERPLNGLSTIYIDNKSSLQALSTSKYGYPGKEITNVFFVGRQGQYANCIPQWNSKINYLVVDSAANYYVSYLGNIYITNHSNVNNINQVPSTSPNRWTLQNSNVFKYQSIFGNLGYAATPNSNDFSNNPLLGGLIVPTFIAPIDTSTSASNIASNAISSSNSINSTIVAPSNQYNSNLNNVSASCYSINQFGTSRYQVTTQATQFVAAARTTTHSVTFPSPGSSFLLSINGLQNYGSQDTTFRGLFYDNMAYDDGWQGDFAEIVTFTSSLTPQEILLVEGYLATKWGLQAALPPSHPFFYSGTIETTCLTGYSPLTFGSIGANVNSSNDKLTVTGLPSQLKIPRGNYTITSFLAALNALLPSGLTVEAGGYLDQKLIWKNATVNDITIEAATQGATILGIDPSSDFTIPSIPNTSSPYPVYSQSYTFPFFYVNPKRFKTPFDAPYHPFIQTGDVNSPSNCFVTVSINNVDTLIELPTTVDTDILNTTLAASLGSNVLQVSQYNTGYFTFSNLTIFPITIDGDGVAKYMFGMSELNGNSVYPGDHLTWTVPASGILQVDHVFEQEYENPYLRSGVDMSTFPEGVYENVSFGLVLQDFIRTTTGLPVLVNYNIPNQVYNSYWYYGLSQSFKNVSPQLSVNLSTSDVYLYNLLGMYTGQYSNETNYNTRFFSFGYTIQNSFNFSEQPSVGDQSFGSDINLFNVVANNNTLNVYWETYSNTPIVLSNHLYTSPDAFVAEINSNCIGTSIYNLSASYMYQPYTLWKGLQGPNYYLYWQLQNADNIYMELESDTTQSALLFGLASNNVKYKVYGNSTPSYVQSFSFESQVKIVEVFPTQYFTVSENGVGVDVHLLFGRMSLSNFVSSVQESIRSTFYYDVTPTQFHFSNWDAVTSTATIDRLNSEMFAPYYLYVRLENNYMEWINTSSYSCTLLASISSNATKLGLSTLPFTIYPNSIVTTDEFGLYRDYSTYSPGDAGVILSPDSNVVVLNSNAVYAVQRRLNSPSPSSQTYTIPSNTYSLSTFVSSNAVNMNWSIDSNNYLWWQNSQNVYTETIIVQNRLCSSVLGLFHASDNTDPLDGNAYITLQTNFFDAPNVGSVSGPPTVSITVTRANASSATITLSNSLSGSYLTTINAAFTSSLGASVLQASVVSSLFKFTNLTKYDITIVADTHAMNLFGLDYDTCIVPSSYTRSHYPVQLTLLKNVLGASFTALGCTIAVNGTNISFGTFSAYQNVFNLIKYLNNGFMTSTDPFIRYVSVSLTAKTIGTIDGLYKLKWYNRGPKAATVTLNAAAKTFLGMTELSFTIPRRPGNISPNPLGSAFVADVAFQVYNIVYVDNTTILKPRLEVFDGGNGMLKWINNSSSGILLTTVASGGYVSAILGISSDPANEGTLLIPAGTMSPHAYNLDPLQSSAATISIFNSSTVGKVITLIDGNYNGSSFAAMVQKAFTTAMGNENILVKFGNTSTNLTFINTLPTNVTINANLKAAIMFGFIDPGTTTPGVTSVTVPKNSLFSSPYSLLNVKALTVCKWDGAEECPTNFSEVLNDSNEIALPFAKKCAKPFSSLLPQVLTNDGAASQKYTCPLGTELIAANQNADPDFPVCSYVCDAPYFDSGTTCGYYPVYSPLDNNTLNILNDNAAVYTAVVTPTQTNSVTSQIQFLLLAVLVSFLLGLVIKTLPSITYSAPTESAAGSVLETILKKNVARK
jgi:hypothetical protein